MDVGGAITNILKALSLLADAISFLFRYAIKTATGVDIPDSLLKIMTIIVVALIVWKFGETMSKIVLFALLFLLLSSLIGLLPIGSLLGGP